MEAAEATTKEDLKVDLSKGHGIGEQNPLQNDIQVETKTETKKSEQRRHFTEEAGGTQTYDDLTFAYATGFYDPYVPSSYFLSFNDEGMHTFLA